MGGRSGTQATALDLVGTHNNGVSASAHVLGYFSSLVESWRDKDGAWNVRRWDAWVVLRSGSCVRFRASHVKLALLVAAAENDATERRQLAIQEQTTGGPTKTTQKKGRHDTMMHGLKQKIK